MCPTTMRMSTIADPRDSDLLPAPDSHYRVAEPRAHKSLARILQRPSKAGSLGNVDTVQVAAPCPMTGVRGRPKTARCQWFAVGQQAGGRPVAHRGKTGVNPG